MKRRNQEWLVLTIGLLLLSLLLGQAAWAEGGEGSGSLILTPVPPPVTAPEQLGQPQQQVPPGGYPNLNPNVPYWQQPPQQNVPNPNAPYYWWSYPDGWNNPYWNNPYGQGDQGTMPPNWNQQPDSPYGWNQDQPYGWGSPYYWGYPYGWGTPYGWGDSYGWAQPNPYDFWSNPQSPYFRQYYPYPYGWGPNPWGGVPYGNQQPQPNWDPNQQYG